MSYSRPPPPPSSTGPSPRSSVYPFAQQRVPPPLALAPSLPPRPPVQPALQPQQLLRPDQQVWQSRSSPSASSPELLQPVPQPYTSTYLPQLQPSPAPSAPPSREPSIRNSAVGAGAGPYGLGMGGGMAGSAQSSTAELLPLHSAGAQGPSPPMGPRSRPSPPGSSGYRDSAYRSSAYSTNSAVSASTAGPAVAGPGPYGHRPISSVSESDSGRSSAEVPLVPGAPGTHSRATSITSRFSLAPDPNSWGQFPDREEADDFLHTPDPKRDYRKDRGGNIFTLRGLQNIGCLIILCTSLIVLFAGFPIISFFEQHAQATNGGYNIGGINSTGQVPQLISNVGIIDAATPASAMTHNGLMDGSPYELVFSDEFEVDGRSFYPGDDPYWEAVNLHYWQTGNLEWYDPRAVTTAGGSLKIWLNDTADRGEAYTGGMVASWNKFCFTGGYVEVSVSLPGKSSVYGLWPAVWTMGNLGRAGYGGSLDGMWPYTYDTCDLGTLKNQTQDGGPPAALTTGDPNWGGELSFLPGQRVSACTCPGEDHPGPMKADGTFPGRSAPEVDILEAQVDNGARVGYVSQSAQLAPFDAGWQINSTSDADYQVYNTGISDVNSYHGGVYQEAASVLTQTNQQCYQQNSGCFSTYGFEIQPGDDGYITWVSNGQPSWTLHAAAIGPNADTKIGQRLIPEEPMYIIANLGISPSFGAIDFANLVFPAYMLIDYVRVYQKTGSKNIGCDPVDHPTARYIAEHPDVYNNPNITTWEQAGQTFPKNRLVDQC
ncbi:glycoside hydrolase family 16 protein [Calocera cornea HHB12733]|uniref:Glycoside hydrolase family 16 protein n=1 Tax=Calocera cornea HHB12733 TaxID=1353952 RepID=A0A165GBV0_9BASI|nr:glycoside hydrolase family 16 protein [Calocera cornea HHB12733]